MAELRILKIDYNPIVFPPLEITANEAGEEGMDTWLVNLKDFLRDHEQRINGNESDAATTDDEGAETEYNTISKTGSSMTSTKSSSSLSVKSATPVPPPPVPTKSSTRANMHGATRSVSNLRSFQLVPGKSAEMERSRSNSENEESRRPSRRSNGTSRTRHLATLQEDRVRHSRGFSHDSHDYIQDNTSEAEGALPSPAEVQQNSRAYFRRLSSLPQSKRVSLSSAKVVEAARGLLFSLSQTHTAVRQYVGFCTDPELTATINRMLYNANAHVGALVDVLEIHDTRSFTADARPVIEACRACVGAFKHVINILHKRVKDLTSQADIRYTRTLLLLLFGASIEIQNSWNCLKPGEVTISPVTASPRTMPALTRLKSGSSAAQLPYLGISGLSTPNSSSASLEVNLAETDEQLYEKIAQATTNTLSMLSLIGDAVSKSAIATAQGPTTPGAVSSAVNNKLRDLAANSVNAGEVSRRLKNKLSSIKTMTEFTEKRKFWEDTNAFVKAVINVAALAKSVSTDFPFSKAILSSLSTVTRSTKELTILLSVSSFSQTMRGLDAKESPNLQNNLNGLKSPPYYVTSAQTTSTSLSSVNKFEDDFRSRPDLHRSDSTIKASQPIMTP